MGEAWQASGGPRKPDVRVDEPQLEIRDFRKIITSLQVLRLIEAALDVILDAHILEDKLYRAVSHSLLPQGCINVRHSLRPQIQTQVASTLMRR